jgi:hypothetical protein
MWQGFCLTCNEHGCHEEFVALSRLLGWVVFVVAVFAEREETQPRTSTALWAVFSQLILAVLTHFRSYFFHLILRSLIKESHFPLYCFFLCRCGFLLVYVLLDGLELKIH